MRKKLRIKFIATSMSVVILVLSIILISINFVMYNNIAETADEIIEILYENDGKFPVSISTSNLSVETPYSTRYFTMMMNSDGTLISSNTKSHLISTEDALLCATYVMQSEKTSGFFEKYRYEIFNTGYGCMVIFVDCEQDLITIDVFKNISVMVFCLSILSIFGLIFIASKIVINPIVESYEKQQEFITNITHEIKTPLAIIKSNTEIIELDNKETEWTKGIHKQINRLTLLMNHFITMSKLNEQKISAEMTRVNISDIVNQSIDDFTQMALSKNVEYDVDILGNIIIPCYKEYIELLIYTLMENAVKYSTEGSKIKIKLDYDAKKMSFKIRNEINTENPIDYKHIFDRFYRADKSRNSKTGGFGVGLSMAKTIVENHNGKIVAQPDGSGIIFTTII